VKKLGLHILDTYTGTLRPQRVIKLVDSSVETCAQVRAQVGPGCLMIYRWYIADQDQLLDDPHEGAIAFVEARMGTMRMIYHVAAPVVFEGLNEVADSRTEEYAIFETARLMLTHELGIGCCVGNWSVGCPDFRLWPRYAPMLRAMYTWDLIGKHEYWPDAWGLADPYLVGRWRYDWLAYPALRGHKIVITECGRDRVAGRGKPGWRRTISEERYKRELSAYDALLSQHDEVWGATVFTAGRSWPHWSQFDINGAIARYIMEA